MLEVYGNCTVCAYVKAFDGCSVVAEDESTLRLFDNASAFSRGHARIVAFAKSHVIATCHSSVEARVIFPQ